MRHYVALVEQGDDGYGVVFPDLPGVISAGNTYDETIRNAHEILAHVASVSGVSGLPKPRTLEQIKQTWEDWDEWKCNYNFVVSLISLLPFGTKTKRINVSINERLLARVDAVANNRSEFISNALEMALS